jgi:crotonobetainyl-CoA:carnitine CoA-transferase CaiB-like acyl-CoA transferase
MNEPRHADLDGILVLCLEQAVAAPYASQRLADAGARVLKVERAEGDFARRYDTLVNGESAYFVWLNHGKESLCLDLKQPDDLALLHAIIAKADVIVQNLAPGAAERLGVGAKTMTDRYPSLIYCSISGYGEDGPYRDQKAYDMLVQGESGLIAINGSPEHAARVGISICDITAGMTAYAAILRALFARSRTGQGRIIEVSLFQAIADWMNVPYLQTRYGNKPPPRVGVHHPTIAPYGAFTCADGKVILLSIQNEREWQNFCIGLFGNNAIATEERFSTNVQRCVHREELETLLAIKFAEMTREEAISRLTEWGIACGRLSEMGDLVSHPQARKIMVEGENGPIDMLAPGARSPGEIPPGGRVPRIGEHSDAIREEFLRS